MLCLAFAVSGQFCLVYVRILYMHECMCMCMCSSELTFNSVKVRSRTSSDHAMQLCGFSFYISLIIRTLGHLGELVMV